MVDEASVETGGTAPRKPGEGGCGDAAQGAEAEADVAATPAADAPAENEAREAGEAPADAQEPEELEDPAALREALAEAQAAHAAAQDQALRAQAEADNTRRRAAREMENARKFAVERLAADVLPAIDSFERAVEAAHAASETTAAEGVELSLKLLTGALEKAGVHVVDPLGAPFDPRFHEAISMVENADAEPGSVTQVVQKGYVLNERVVRAAMVIVGKAPPAKDTEDAAPAKG